MDSISLIAKRVFELFVANPYAIAIQQSDGKYITKYVPYDEHVLEAMYRCKGSAGCYQQGFNNGLIKWVCLDFDCRDKENPPILDLYHFIEQSLLNKLCEKGITYLTEFSGRRGIHVWILFDEVLPKSVGYKLVCNISNNIDLDSERFGLDLFPATDSAVHNKVGKQVKFPLSCHKKGQQSYFFENEKELICPEIDNFYDWQNNIIQHYSVNQISKLQSNHLISLEKEDVLLYRYKKIEIAKDILLSARDVITGLSQTKVYKEIFDRLMFGHILPKDWYVILGTVGCIDRTGELLKSIFSYSASYDEQTTTHNIEQWKDKYYPATFEYLYKLYDLSIEKDLLPNDTGIEYLSRIYGFELLSIEEIMRQNQADGIYSVEVTKEKEKNYLLKNDENIVISIWNGLNAFSIYDCKCIEVEYTQITRGIIPENMEPKYTIIHREENEEKERDMISLSVKDRILTTHLALNLAYDLVKNKSFSYNVSYLSKQDIFYHWYTSWGNYIEKIKSYLEIPFYNEWGVISLDIKGFYDNIDFLSIYGLLKDELSEKSQNIIKFLIKYNEVLMRSIKGERFGVPQGPAYARIISEIFLDKIFENLEKESKENNAFVYYRYVDDIIIFYKNGVDSKKLFESFQRTLQKNGLMLNDRKSRVFGKISELTKEDRDILLRRNKFNYMFQSSSLNSMLTKREKENLFNRSQQTDFSIEDVAYIFGRSTDTAYCYRYYHCHAERIFSSGIGRGSIFHKFYSFVFSDPGIMEEALTKDRFWKIPFNSVNFKNCISTLYLSLQNGVINSDSFEMIKEIYLKKIDLAMLEEEERTTIASLIGWDKNE